MGGSSSTPLKITPESVQQTQIQTDKPIQVAQHTGTSVEPEQITCSTTYVPTTISPSITLVPSEYGTLSSVTTPVASIQYENAATPVADTPVQVESPVIKQEVSEVKEVQEKKEKQEVEAEAEDVVTLKEFVKTVQVVPVKLGRKNKAVDVVPKKVDSV